MTPQLAMTEVTLRLLVLQFLVAAIFWAGSAPLDRFRWAQGPEWVRVELTRLVLPLLMVSAGLLFFSAPFAPLWQTALHLEGFQGIPAAWSRWAFVASNLGVIGAVLVATGGTPRSPFLPLLVALPLFTWAVGAPTAEVTGAGVLGLVVLFGTGRFAHRERPRPADFVEAADLARRRGRWLTLLTSILTLAVALWMGGRLNP